MEQHLSQYRIFYEVARCGNISRAAKELYISQPAISKAIGKLEGVQDVSISFMAQKLTIEAEDGRFEEILRQAVKACKKVEPDCEIVIR